MGLHRALSPNSSANAEARSVTARSRACFAVSKGNRQLGRLVDELGRMVLEPGGNTEQFCAAFLDHNRSVLGRVQLGLGCEGALTFRMRQLFESALSRGASAIIMAHNHPSGDCRPSKQDIDATERIAWIARALDIELLDHLIFTETAVYSLRAGDVL
ncbi:MAG: JAB domain-containing protein [Pseudomonadota bacterium]